MADEIGSVIDSSKILEMIRERRLNAADPTRAGRLRLQELREGDEFDIDTTIDFDSEITDIANDDIIEALNEGDSDEGGLLNIITKIAANVAMDKLKLDQDQRDLVPDDLSEDITRQDVLESADDIGLPPIPGFGLDEIKQQDISKLKKALGATGSIRTPDTVDDTFGDLIRSGFKEDLSADALQADITAGIGEQFAGRSPSFSMTKSGQFRGTSGDVARQYLASKIAQRNQAIKNQINLARLAVDSTRVKQQADAAEDRLKLGRDRLEDRIRNRRIRQEISPYKTANSAIGKALDKLILLDRNQNFKGYNPKIQNAEQKASALIKMRDENNMAITEITNRGLDTKSSPRLPSEVLIKEEIKGDK